MQIQSRDGRIIINITEDIVNKSIYPQSDFSIIETPISSIDAEKMFHNLYQTQRSNHICLATVRLPKKLRLRAFNNLLFAEDAGFRYHDHVTIVSEEEYKSIPSNLTQIGETCVLFTKGEEMNKNATAWFREEVGDCSNVWDVTKSEYESMIDKTVSRHFSCELGVLMSQLASPLISRRFLVLGLIEPAMAEFAYEFDVALYGITVDEISARRVIKAYHKFLDKAEPRSKNG
jgi:hypothetical protein